MSFLRVLVLLAVITACVLAQDAPSCGSGGQIDTFQKGLCNCYSGYAPATEDGTDCKQHPKCAPNMPEDVSTMNSYAPMKPVTYFAHDSLEIVQKVPLVANRKAAWIQFVVPTGFPNAGTAGRKTCQYPGPLWNKTVNGFDCIDEYRASLPWSQNGPCGFARDVVRSVNGTEVISSTLVTTVVDTFTTGEESFQRLSTTSYLVSVSFATQKTIQSGVFSAGVIDSTSDGVLTKYIVSDSVYDPATGITIVKLVTTVAWPYYIDVEHLADAFDGVVPPITGVVVTLASDDDSTVSCTNNARSICSQKWKASFASSAGCIDNLQGVYSFSVPLLCRDYAEAKDADLVVGACPDGTADLEFTINVRKTNLCGTTSSDTSTASSFTLTPYSDADHEFTSVQFQTGDRVYWTFSLANPVVSIKTVSFNTIQMVLAGVAGAVPDVLFSNGAATAIGTAVNLQVSSLTGTIAPGQTGELSFSYDLLRGQLPRTVAALTASNLQAQISTSVVVDIQYFGNNKRSVAEILSSMDAMSAGTDSRQIRVIASDLMDNTAEPANPVSGDAPASAIAQEGETSGASQVVVASFAIMFAFVFLLL